jgi:hypothetical protein
MTKREFIRKFGDDFVISADYTVKCRRCGRQWGVGKRDLWDEQGEFAKVMRHGHGEPFPAAA